jgi:hypothetical protein
MTTFYVIAPVKVGSQVFSPGEVVDDQIGDSVADIIATAGSGALYQTGSPILAQGAARAEKARHKGATEAETEVFMKAALQELQLALTPELLGWSLQIEVHIDADKGSDLNDGKSRTTALKTIEEWLRRLDKPYDGAVTSTINVYLYGDFSTSTVTVDVPCVNGVTVNVTGEIHIQATHMLTSTTPYNAAGGVAGSYTVLGLDLTPYVGMSARVNAGPRMGLRSLIASQLSTGVFRGCFCDESGLFFGEPQAGDVIDIVTYTKIGGNFRVVGPEFGQLDFINVDVGTPGALHTVRVTGGGVGFFGSIVRSADWDRNTQGAVAGCGTYGMRVSGYMLVGANMHMNTLGDSALAATGGSGFIVSIDVEYIFGDLKAGRAGDGEGSIDLQADTVVEVGTFGGNGVIVVGKGLLTIDFGATLLIISSQAYATGINVYTWGEVAYDQTVVFAGTLPTSKYRVAGTNYASLPVTAQLGLAGAGIVQLKN